MSAHSPRRFLRPRHVFHTLGHVWVVDESHPAAALFDPDTRRFVRLVSWTELPAAPIGGRPPTILADRAGLWVQNHRDGPLARIGVDGIVGAEFTDGQPPVGAGDAGAWCHTIRKRAPDVAATVDAPPREFARSTVLVALPHGGTREVPVTDAAVVSVEADETWLYLGVEHVPWRRVPTEPNSSGRRKFEARFDSSVLRVPLDGPIPDRIGPGTDRVEGRQPGYTSEYADQSYNESHYRKRALDSGTRWHWGIDRSRGALVVRAYHRDALTVDIEIDQAKVVDGAAAAGALWITTRSRDESVVGRCAAVVGTDGSVEGISTGNIDISDRCRPIGPPPLDHDSYIEYCLRHIDGIQLSHNISNVTAEYVGEWPHGRIDMSFDHVGYPGLTLTARRRVYDENGTRLDAATGHIRALLAEQAGTRSYPPADAAIDGVLHV